MVSIAVVAMEARARLEFFVLLRDIGDQVFTKLPCLGNHLRVGSAEWIVSNWPKNVEKRHLRDVKEHVFIAFPVRCGLEIPGSAALYLHSASGLLLNMLHVRATVANDLSTQVESLDWLQSDWDLLFRPFALNKHNCQYSKGIVRGLPYPSKLVSLDLLLWLSSSEASLVDQLGEFLLDEFIDLSYGRLQARFAGAGDVQVQRGVLIMSASAVGTQTSTDVTYSRGCHALVGIVVSACRDILK